MGSIDQQSMDYESSDPVTFIVSVFAGDRPKTGKDASIKVILHDKDGKMSDALELPANFKDENHKRGDINASVPVHLNKMGTLTPKSKITRVELYKEADKEKKEGSPFWHLDKIVVENMDDEIVTKFPVFHVIKDGFYRQVEENDTFLPQNDPHQEQRKVDLANAQKDYVYAQKLGPTGPVQSEEVPDNENFSFIRETELGVQVADLTIESLINQIPWWRWDTIDDMKKPYTRLGCSSHFPTPVGVDRWDVDKFFGMQRVRSINHSIITLVKSMDSIPKNFPVTDEILQPIIGMKMEEAISRQKLFIVDLAILKGLFVKEGFTLCNPLALFFEFHDDELKPVAIQLYQEPNEKSPNNPIFTVNDPIYTWNLAKFWYNNADAAYHQAVAHLGQTHLLSEGICVSVHRNLSYSHPIFKLMAPHFLYVIAINSLAVDKLICDGGWVDKVMNYGATGMKELICKAFPNWRMDIEGTLPADLENRGVELSEKKEETVLRGYAYRDDASLLYDCIKKYVGQYVDLYYVTPGALANDYEIQAWAADLVKPRDGSDGGLGLPGVPGNGNFQSNEELVQVVSSVIFQASVTHACANFDQYEEYGFPPNYPLTLRGDPPADKSVRTEQDLVNALPDKKTTLNIMTITKILSTQATNHLGHFEVDYITDPLALKIVDFFRLELTKTQAVLQERNLVERRVPYTSCYPNLVPNSISI